ncbi:MAG: hypothetical protein KDA60_19075 [Planctomycetales bacterium]|nr:hypothetical protein [Planctomycetales bacterium]
MDYAILQRQFEAAANRWPGMESLLVCWPETDPAPELAMQNRGAAHRVPGGWHVTVHGLGCELDTPHHRFRSGEAGMLVRQRCFGRSHKPNWLDVTDSDTEAAEQWRTLGRMAADLLTTDHGLSADTMRWKPRRTRWTLAVHELVNPPWNQLPGYHEGYRVQTLDDVFLASTDACVKLAGKWKPPQAMTEPDTPLQSSILKALDGKALKAESLAKVVSGGDKRRLYKNGGIKELMEQNRVKNKRNVGYYRPDRPPGTN